MRKFLGYKRPDGRIGIRNHVLVMATSVCASDTANSIAECVEGAVSFHNQVGCAQVPPDAEFTYNTMAGFAANPNVYGTILVSLGCETCQWDYVAEYIKKRTNKPLEHIVIQENGGTLNTISEGIRMATKMVAEAKMVQREPVLVSSLILATECGGSDPTSGLASNRVLGDLSDHLVDDGATVILSETTELIGGEDLLAERAVSPEVSKRIYDIIYRYEDSIRQFGEDVRATNPGPGNRSGGLSTLEEKSLGCIHKGGTRPITAVYDYSDDIPVTQKGLVIMDTPGQDPSSVVGMVAGGAQVCVFTTGLGTPMGNPLIPVIKITGNATTYKKLNDNIDFDASRYLSGEKTMDELVAELYDYLMDVCNGVQPKAESLGVDEIAIVHVCNFV